MALSRVRPRERRGVGSATSDDSTTATGFAGLAFAVGLDFGMAMKLNAHRKPQTPCAGNAGARGFTEGLTFNFERIYEREEKLRLSRANACAEFHAGRRFLAKTGGGWPIVFVLTFS